MVQNIQKGKTYVVNDSAPTSGCGCSGLKRGQKIVAKISEQPDSDGDFRLEGEWINQKYLDEVKD